MSLLDVPFQNRGINMELGICTQSVKRAFARAGTNIGREDLACSQRSSSSGSRSGVCAGHRSFSTPNFYALLGTLCTGEQS